MSESFGARRKMVERPDVDPLAPLNVAIFDNFACESSRPASRHGRHAYGGGVVMSVMVALAVLSSTKPEYEPLERFVP